jgi:large subunit ribosomal protein L23
MIKDPYAIIRRPVMTEKTHKMRQSENHYTFQVHKEATKDDIRRAIEKLFDVKVDSVNTMNVRPKVKVFRRMKGRPGKTRGWKKAIVTLVKGSKGIDVL